MELDFTDLSEAWNRIEVPSLDAPHRAGSSFELDTTGDLAFSGYSGTSTAIPTVLWDTAGQGLATWGESGGLSLSAIGPEVHADGVAGAPAARNFASKESLVAGGGAQRRYEAASMYDEDSRVSCSNCRWVLEDPDWCCKHDCNDKSGPDYRQAYVCADPTDTSGRLTSACEVETECKRSEPPKMCSASKLRELQQYNSVLDARCPARATGSPYPVAPSPGPFYTSAPQRPVGHADRNAWTQAPWA